MEFKKGGIEMFAIKVSTVNLVARLLRPLAEVGALSMPEEREIVAQLRSLAKSGAAIPELVPKLIDQSAAAEMLGISLANFKKMERNEAFPFRRKRIGTAVRYRNTDIVKFILSEEHLTDAGNAQEAAF
jgi:predicted DNA-binding transcriptional regulator AlpA